MLCIWFTGMLNEHVMYLVYWYVEGTCCVFGLLVCWINMLCIWFTGLLKEHVVYLVY